MPPMNASMAAELAELDAEFAPPPPAAGHGFALDSEPPTLARAGAAQVPRPAGLRAGPVPREAGSPPSLRRPAPPPPGLLRPPRRPRRDQPPRLHPSREQPRRPLGAAPWRESPAERPAVVAGSRWRATGGARPRALHAVCRSEAPAQRVDRGHHLRRGRQEPSRLAGAPEGKARPSGRRLRGRRQGRQGHLSSRHQVGARELSGTRASDLRRNLGRPARDGRGFVRRHALAAVQDCAVLAVGRLHPAAERDQVFVCIDNRALGRLGRSGVVHAFVEGDPAPSVLVTSKNLLARSIDCPFGLP